MEVNLSIPAELPSDLQNKLNLIIQDYKDENLTLKGYEKKRNELLSSHREILNYNFPTNIDRKHIVHIPGRNQSLSSTFKRRNLSNNLSRRLSSYDNVSIISPSRSNPMASTASNFNLDSPPHSMYKVTTNSTLFRAPTRSTLHNRQSSMQLSLPSHGMSQENNNNYLPMIPLLPRNTASQISSFSKNFPSLLPILRGRFEIYDDQTAMITLNAKNKETYITWGKLYLKAEKVAHELNRNKLYKMDKVLLWYNKEECVDFTVALLGCFIAGMIAVPISFDTYILSEIKEIIKQTNSKFILISNECYRQLDNLHVSSSSNNKVKLNRNEIFKNVSFIKTDDLGTYSKAKKKASAYELSDIAYIEFTRTPLGRLSGVVIKHNILMNQFARLADILDSRHTSNWKKSHIRKPFDKKIPLSIATKEQTNRFILMNILDPTRSTGLIFGTLFNIFTGNLLITVSDELVTKSSGYESLIDRYRADILLNDQLQLKQIVINYLENPVPVQERKKHKLNFSCVKCCLTACTTVDTDATDMVVQKWLKNLGCIDASLCYSPFLTMTDFGGIFISTRDELKGLDNFPIHNKHLNSKDEIYLKKEKLRSNTVDVEIPKSVDVNNAFQDYIKVQSFGYPIPDTLLCIVNPDDATLVPDLCVGEIWLSSNNLVKEFYQMDKVNEFVFNAKLNYSKMFSFVNETSRNEKRNRSMDRLDTILNICPATTQFLRTKLMGFVHNGKLYILSLIEDMFLQNKLIRLPNWAHTSDLKKSVKHDSKASPDQNADQDTTSISEPVDSIDSRNSYVDHQKRKRVVETHYLQQITETLVRTVGTITDVSAFELNQNKEEHFLVIVVESSLAKKNAVLSTYNDSALLASSMTERQKEVLEKKLNELTDQIYRILWIFHKIQPMCVVVVGRNTLPRRYCSLELANSTIEKKFINGELNARFVKFQFDNIILDFVPHSVYYNESIFSEHLSGLRKTYLEDRQHYNNNNNNNNDSVLTTWQSSGIDYREITYDPRAPTKKLNDFQSILEILEWRIENIPNEMAFNDGRSASNNNSNENNIHRNLSWKSFDLLVGAVIKKIVGSKIPITAGEYVVILCDNSVEYVATMMACFYCNLTVIPVATIDYNKPEEDFKFLTNLFKVYNVKRVFIDARINSAFSNNASISKLFKQYKYLFPKITVVSKLKMKNTITIQLFKRTLNTKHSYKPGVNSTLIPCLLWINRDKDTTSNIHIKMNHATLLNHCKILDQTLQLSGPFPIFSLCSYTRDLGLILSCFMGIYVGNATHLFHLDNILAEPKDFLIGIQNQNVKDLFLNIETFHKILDKASYLLSQGKATNEKPRDKHGSSNVLSKCFRNVKNIMIPFSGRPSYTYIENLLLRYKQIVISPQQINFIYQHHFNFLVSLRSYLDIPPINMYLEHSSLREGIVKEVDPTSSKIYNALRLQDSGIVPVCTDITIVNPETLLPCIDGELGEIWCCSEANVIDYSLLNSNNKLGKSSFITEQLQSKFSKEVQNGLTYLRTGDLGFIRTIKTTNSNGDYVALNLLYVLGSISESVEILGLTHFVGDLERTVKDSHKSINRCIVAKAGGLLVCLIQCNASSNDKYPNITALAVSGLLNTHGVILDLVAFVKNDANSQLNKYSKWENNRSKVMQDWFQQRINIDSQFAINYGENISIYLLSDFERHN